MNQVSSRSGGAPSVGERVLLVNGYVHTPEDPGATALLVEGEQIAWIGSEGATLAHSDGVDRVIDLAGALLAPAFVDGHVHIGSRHADTPDPDAADPEATLNRWSRVGVTAVHEMAARGTLHSRLDLMLRVSDSGDVPLVLWYRPARTADRDSPPGAIGIAAELPAAGSGTAASLPEQIRTALGLGLQSRSRAHTSDELTGVLAGFEAVAADVGLERVRLGRHRIELGVDPDERQLAQFARLGLTASVQPVVPSVPEELVPGHIAGAARRLDRLAAAGVPMVLGSGRATVPVNPWAVLRELIDPSDGGPGISARAAFAAHTRGGWRAVGYDDAGMLRTGAVASLAVWDCPELMVQEADERVSRWSTDPRSGTPLLPALRAGADLPTCRMTMRAGRIIHEQAAA